MENNVIVAEGSDIKQEPMIIEESRDFIFGLDKFVFNDQGSAGWYKNKYSGFDDSVYQILELYSLGGIRYKQWRSHLKKLKKKGKLIQDTMMPEEVLRFKKINLNE